MHYTPYLCTVPQSSLSISPNSPRNCLNESKLSSLSSISGNSLNPSSSSTCSFKNRASCCGESFLRGPNPSLRISGISHNMAKFFLIGSRKNLPSLSKCASLHQTHIRRSEGQVSAAITMVEKHENMTSAFRSGKEYSTPAKVRHISTEK